MSLPYRPCVGIMLLNQNNHVFVARRIDATTEAWQMPQGGIDKDELPQNAALRELLEEIGTNNAKILKESSTWLRYDLPEDLIPTVWGGRYKGQEQKWFLMQFTGEEKDINIETEIPEFLEWKWVEPHALPELIVPFKRQLYCDIVEEFLPYITKP